MSKKANTDGQGKVGSQVSVEISHWQVVPDKLR